MEFVLLIKNNAKSIEIQNGNKFHQRIYCTRKYVHKPKLSIIKVKFISYEYLSVENFQCFH